MRRLEEEEEKEVEQERLKVEKEQEQLRTRRHQLEQEVQAWSSLRNLTYRSVNRLRSRSSSGPGGTSWSRRSRHGAASGTSPTGQSID
jgi:hypothetical protein